MNPSSIKFIPCDSHQLDILRNVALKAYMQHYDYYWDDGGLQYAEKSFNLDSLKIQFNSPGSVFYLVYRNDTIVGFLKINKHNALQGFSNLECIELERIYILNEAKGQGIGKKCLDFVIEKAKELDKTILWLKVMAKSDAVFFYSKMKFVYFQSNLLDYPLMKEEYREIITMKLDLK